MGWQWRLLTEGIEDRVGGGSVSRVGNVLLRSGLANSSVVRFSDVALK